MSKTSRRGTLPKIAISHPPTSFQYLWLKYVTGFDPSKCCQPCLVGERSRYISLRMEPKLWYPMNESSAPFLYLCASFGDYRTNVHVAAEAAVGKKFKETTADGTTFYFENLRRVDIPQPAANVASRYSRRQAACRNWWFGASQWPEALRTR